MKMLPFKQLPTYVAIATSLPRIVESRFRNNGARHSAQSPPDQSLLDHITKKNIHHNDISKLSPKDFEVSRELLESKYPVFQSFDGAMHAGLMPAAFVDKKHGGGVTNDNIGGVGIGGDDGSSADDDGGDSFSSYFFWLFQPNFNSEGVGDTSDARDESFRDDTLVIWLNGGPGCSSMIGLLVENGPITLPTFKPGIPANENPFTNNLQAPFEANPFAWTKKTAMLYVEQPGGVGFSTASKQWTGDQADERTEEDVARDFYAFLQNLYRVFDHGAGDDAKFKLRDKKMYLAGESYAGMYIPSIARSIYLANERVKRTMDEEAANALIIDLQGVAIGNGWIDAVIQGPTVIDYAFWHGMIDLRTFQSLHHKWNECIAQKIEDSDESPFHPFTTPDECGITSAVMQASGSGNMYDVTTYDTYPVHVDPEGTISKFFNDPDIRTALNAPPLEELSMWQACVPGSGRRRRLEESPSTTGTTHDHGRELILLAKDRPSVVPYIAELLDDADIHVLMYNGDLDLACSAQSTEMALNTMDWTGNKQWMDPDTTKWMEWKVDDQVAGHTKRYNNLEFLVVYNSGHFVPTNQARNSLNLIGRLLDGKPFGDEELPQFPSNRKSKISLSSSSVSVALSDTASGDGSTVSNVFSFLGGALISCLVTSYVLLKKKKRKALTESPNAFYPKTEFTPLKDAFE